MKYLGKEINTVARGDRVKRDCTVRALATVTGRDYWQTYHYLAAQGRQHNRGFDIASWLRRHGNCALGHAFTPVTKLFPFDTYLLLNNSHAWAVVAGVLHDAEGSRASRWTQGFLVVPLTFGQLDPTIADFAAAQKFATI